MKDERLKFEITEHIGVIKKKKGGWNKELNLVSWNNGAPKYDIREWSPDHDKMSKGITFTEEELLNLCRLVSERFGLSFEKEPFRRAADNNQVEKIAETDPMQDSNNNEEQINNGRVNESFLDALEKLEASLK